MVILDGADLDQESTNAPIHWELLASHPTESIGSPVYTNLTLRFKSFGRPEDLQSLLRHLEIR